MQQLAGGGGRLPRALERCVAGREGAAPQLCSSAAAVQRGVYSTCRRARSPHRLHVSCPAVEQDTEAPSTSGRHHTPDGGLAAEDIIHSLLAHDPPSISEEVQQADRRKELQRRIKGAGSLPLLCELIQAEGAAFDHKLTSHALYRLSLLCHAYFTQLQSAHLTSQEAQQAAWLRFVDPALKTLGQLLLQHAHACDPWSVAISLWAYGNLQCSEEAVLAALSERGLQLVHTFTALDCASALVGIAKLRVRPRSQREFVDHLLQHTHLLLTHVEEWGTQEVTSVVWALSKLGAAGPARRPLLEGLVEMSLWRLEDFKVCELVIIVASLGRLRLRLPLQLIKLANYLSGRLSALGPQDAANLMWAFAKLDFKPTQLLDQLPAVVMDRLGTFKPQEMCNLLYGYGHLRHAHPALLEAIAKACTPRLHEFSTQDLCLTVWSYGVLGYSPGDLSLFDAACRVLMQRKERLLPMQLTMFVKGLAKAGYQPPAAFMQTVAQLALAKLQQFTPIELSQLLWAYATAGYRDVALFEAVVSLVIQQLAAGNRRMTKTTVDTVLWACQRVGFWPQVLVDMAEMRGLYVKTQPSSTQAMEPLLAAAGPVAAAADAAAAASSAAAASAAQAAAAAAAGPAAAQVSAQLLSAVSDAFAGGAAAATPDTQPPLQQQQQEGHEQQPQVQEQAADASRGSDVQPARQALLQRQSRLQRPQVPHHVQLQQQQQQQQQLQQQQQEPQPLAPPQAVHRQQEQQAGGDMWRPSLPPQLPVAGSNISAWRVQSSSPNGGSGGLARSAASNGALWLPTASPPPTPTHQAGHHHQQQ